MSDRPPLGIMPEFMWKEIRLKQIDNAVDRYEAAGKPIPPEWAKEHEELLEWLDHYNQKKKKKEKFKVEVCPISDCDTGKKIAVDFRVPMQYYYKFEEIEKYIESLINDEPDKFKTSSPIGQPMFKPTQPFSDIGNVDAGRQPAKDFHEWTTDRVEKVTDEITFEKLDAAGFERYNSCFTYRSFPAPLYRTFRIDKKGNDWIIYPGYGDIPIIYPKTMFDVMGFLKKNSPAEQIKQFKEPEEKIKIHHFRRHDSFKGNGVDSFWYQFAISKQLDQNKWAQIIHQRLEAMLNDEIITKERCNELRKDAFEAGGKIYRTTWKGKDTINPVYKTFEAYDKDCDIK